MYVSMLMNAIRINTSVVLMVTALTQKGPTLVTAIKVTRFPTITKASPSAKTRMSVETPTNAVTLAKTCQALIDVSVPSDMNYPKNPVQMVYTTASTSMNALSAILAELMKSVKTRLERLCVAASQDFIKLVMDTARISTNALDKTLACQTASVSTLWDRSNVSASPAIVI